MAYIDAKVLEAAGFSDAISPRVASAVISIAGVEGSGKTTWALSGPKPLLYQATDFGDQGVIQKAKGQIIPRSYKLDIPHDYRAFVDRTENEADRKVREGRLANYVHEHFYVPFYDDFVKGIKMGIRCAVWDNAVDIWENVRLSVYGRVATNRDDLKTEANAKFREMVRLANVHGIVLIMIQHLKPAFESYTAPDGQIKWRMNPNKMEMQGFDKAPFLVTSTIWTKQTGVVDGKPQFELEVRKCRDNAGLVGRSFPSMPFEDTMAMLVPSVETWD